MLNNQHAAATMKIAIDFAQKRYWRSGQAEDIAMAGIEYIIRYNKTSTMPSRWYICRNVIKAGQDAGYKKKAEQHDQIYTAIPRDKHGESYESALGDTAMKILDQRREVRNPKCKFVFFNPDTLNRWGDLKKSFEDAVKKATAEAIKQKSETTGLDTFTFHDLRHTYISHLVMRGVPITHVKELAGHKTLAMTMRYAHLDPNTLKAGVAQLPF